MPVVTSNAVTRQQLRKAFSEWRKGASKVALEERLLGTTAGRGTFLTRLWVERLGIETRGYTRSQLDQFGRVR